MDVGGTFTDAALLADGRLYTGKAPTTPRDQSEGVMAAVRDVLAAAGSSAGEVERFVHGMTVGTNALLEGRTARTALLATEGFTDLEELGRQARAELYRLCAGHPPPLVPASLRVAVPERTGPDGVLRPLDEELMRSRLAGLEAEAAAVCLLWGFLHPAHEQAVGELLPEGMHVSLSHETAGVFREYERCATTVVDAALSPLLRRYLERLTERAREAGLPGPEVMLSSGGTADAAIAARHGSWTVLSGPAGGAVGAARAGAADAVGLDMGGTSCDVSLILGGAAALGSGREVGGRALALPMVDVHTVGAGGGSIAWRDAGGALQVGPRSAGADPGPACYGRGGELPTVTDAHLLLGHLDPGSPLAGGVRLDRDAAAAAVGRLAEELSLSLEETAAGIVRVAGSAMAQAVRVVTVERGVDPRELTLVPFGGAGPLHAAAIADELGMRRVLVPVASGVLSALGLVLSERRRDLVESVLLTGAELTRDRIEEAVERLAARGRAELHEPEAGLRVGVDLRYAGQGFELTVDAGGPSPDPAELRRAFDRAHEERYGYSDPDAELELVTVRVAVHVPGPVPPEATEAVPDTFPEAPAVIPLPGSTLVVPSGWRVASREADALVLERSEAAPSREHAPAGAARLDPIDLQVMLGGLRAACDEMGAVLVRSAHSANIKERRDASTALFDAAGEMVMQAEHIPVHLGAMPAAIAAVLGEEQRPGEPWILNDPYRGGTHLPDITVITPAFHAGELVGFAASRAHHADVGAPEPGSMPSDSRTLADEGVVIPPSRLTGELVRELAARMRNPGQREADLRAQVAAGRAGAGRVAALIERFGIERFRAGMRDTLDYAERRTRARIAELDDGARRGPRRARGRRGRPRAAAAGTGRGRGDHARLQRERAAARWQPELPAARDPVRLLLRPARADRPGRARLLGRLPAADGDRSGGLAPERAPACRGGGGQRRDLLACGGPRARRLRPGPRPGHDEQPDARQRPLHLLRDARRRPGRVPGRRRAERGPRGDVEHAQHSARGAREGVPAARGRVRAPAGLGRRGGAARRGRRRARARGARGDALLADHGAAPACAAGRCRWVAGRSW